jgi:hypothetical protein
MMVVPLISLSLSLSLSLYTNLPVSLSGVVECASRGGGSGGGGGSDRCYDPSVGTVGDDGERARRSGEGGKESGPAAVVATIRQQLSLARPELRQYNFCHESSALERMTH